MILNSCKGAEHQKNVHTAILANQKICNKKSMYVSMYKAAKMLVKLKNLDILYIHSCDDLEIINNYVVKHETSEDANLFVFITHHEPPSARTPFNMGAAYIGTVCMPDDANVNGGTNNGIGFRVSINSWVISDLQLTEVKENIWY